ncbi:hypothetical protein [Mediterraneibacter gnavus]|uniref:hypothetical protein n=1 Tax=Mediterraneibacter gnavus TaxID=33038 RepID=UPI000677CD1B|nr:hypothetical protein [Mediterraneibacter gnavus]
MRSVSKYRLKRNRRSGVVKKKVPRNEFYLAGQNNMEISENLIVHPYEYEGQRYIRFHGKKLKVI